MRPKTYRLECDDYCWDITVHGTITQISEGRDSHSYQSEPEVEHEDSRTAFRFTQNAIKQKKKEGFTEVRAQNSKRSNHADRQHSDQTGAQYTRKTRRFDDVPPYSGGVRPAPSRPTNKRHPPPEPQGGDLRKHLQKIRHKTEHHDRHLADDTDSVMTDNDTDSIASTVSVASKTEPGPHKGVSPLNRRRLALKPGESCMDAATAPHPALLTRVSTTYFLRSQMAGTKLERSDTAEMMSPTTTEPLTRMETMGRWENWREETSAQGPEKRQRPSKSQGKPYNDKTPKSNKQTDSYAKLLTTTDLKDPQPKLKRKSSKVQRSSQTVTESQPRLTRKKSTTAELRLAVANQQLADSPGRGTEGVDTGPSNTTGAGAKLKRKATTLLSPLPESSQADKKKVVSKKVMVLTPAESLALRTSSPKRQATVLLDSSQSPAILGGHRAKRLCVSAPIPDTADGLLYMPHRTEWPVTLTSPIVWRVPLVTAEGRSLQGHSLFVDDTKCLIAVEDGSVVCLDAEVKPVQRYKLPSGVKCLVSDEGFLYAGCQDGGLYDVTHETARLVSLIKGFGQLLCIDVYNGIVAISDQHCNVAMVSHSGDILWRHKSKGEYGWMVKVDETGIYHGHSKGVTKYSITSGSQLWHLDTQDPVYHGVKDDDHLFVAVGNIIQKVNKYSGVISQTYDKGKSETMTVHCVAVTGGLVIAGGKNIVCYDENSGDVVYILKHPFKPAYIQYYQGRLLCVGSGSVTAVDLTQETVQAARSHILPETVDISLNSSTRQVAPLKRVATVTRNQSGAGLLVQCVKPDARKGKLVVKAISDVKNKSWAIQLSPDLHREGATYVVDELRPCPAGGYYRVYGDIKEVE